ncbi:MAG: UvrD-helicase domain-containing protein [Bacteroidota bacterium]
MQLTNEQQQIIQSSGNIKINAVAGSGKTTTVMEYAKAQDRRKRILYLAFNRSVKREAKEKFAAQGLHNVRVETAHSLAYRQTVRKYGYKVRSQSYKSFEVAKLLQLPNTGQKHGQYILANHVNKFMSYFCNSEVAKVQYLDYASTVHDKEAIDFVYQHYDLIERQTRLLLAKMDRREIDIIHDFYLKKYQLDYPQLPYDYILFDEGQDASAAMLDVFLRQKATKVIVGDTHQQIYAWRYAINSLQKVDFKDYHLSTSFRFDQNIADLANQVLNWKQQLSKGNIQPIIIKGIGNHKQSETKAILGRTNLGLLLKAIEFAVDKAEVDKIYFEGNFNSYAYASEGASLYDVLNLYTGKRHLIRDELIKTMRDLEDLEDYMTKTEDLQLMTMVEIVKEYGEEIPDILREIKDKHVTEEERHEAEMIFSTVHRSKGMEYDIVHLVNDFIPRKTLEEIAESRPKSISAKLQEEINLLYVAITRAKHKLYIPDTLLPPVYPNASNIQILKTKQEEVEATETD